MAFLCQGKTYPIDWKSACSREEIKKLLDVRNAEDYLLKLRADEIAENSRFHRVFLARKKSSKGLVNNRLF